MNPADLICRLSTFVGAVDLSDAQRKAQRENPSVLYVMAHPDDEDAALLTWLARKACARTAVFSLTRGESGANAAGHEVFDALGERRTWEMLRAAKGYGVQDVYFGRCFDYGYSKRVDEAWERWGRQEVLRDLVQVIRVARPDVIISRFVGDVSDGHAHHQAVGVAAREALPLAADPNAFPELGLQTHLAQRLFVPDLDGPVRVRVADLDEHTGRTFAELARQGFLEHRTQGLGAYEPAVGEHERRYRAVAGHDGKHRAVTEHDRKHRAVGQEHTSFFEDVKSGHHECVLAALDAEAERARTRQDAETDFGSGPVYLRRSNVRKYVYETPLDGVPPLPFPPEGGRIEAPPFDPLVAVKPRDLSVSVDDVTVGYVPGPGDCIPSAVAELGLRCETLGVDKPFSVDRQAVVVLGVRAFLTHDAITLGQRLKDYVTSGGHAVVLYQTQEFVPTQHAPVSGELPENAPEVCEEDAAVKIVRDGHPMLTSPNRIASDDFEDWFEQRGSKFWTSWSEVLEPLVESADEGEQPHRGIWLTGPVGEGRFTYCALALHRQLPLGVGGAFRILANLLTRANLYA